MREDFSSLGLRPTVESVTAADFRRAGDHRAWDISWSSIPGNVMETSNFSCTGINLTTAYTGDGICSTVLVENSAGSVPISGTFTLTVTNSGEMSEEDVFWGESSQSTVQLAHNASAADLQAALEDLEGVAAVAVERTKALPQEMGGGGSYLITFSGSSSAIAAPTSGLSLGVSADNLNGTRVGATVRVVYPGSRWGGEFALSLGGLEGPALSFDAQPEEVQGVIATLATSVGSGGEGNVEVWRETVDSGFRWAVAFSGGCLDGDIDLLKVRGVSWSCIQYASELCSTALYAVWCSGENGRHMKFVHRRSNNCASLG